MIILGFHHQNGTKEQVVSFYKGNKVKFPIFQGGQIKGISVSGLPHFCLFDHTGEMIYEGKVIQADKKLDEAMSRAPDPMVGEGPYKKLATLAKSASQHKDLGKTMGVLRKKIEENKDEAEVTEANMLLGRIDRYAQRLKGRADGAKESEPLQYQALCQQLAQEFKGDEIGTEAENTLAELKKDAAFQKNIEADKKFAKLSEAVDKFKPCQGNKPLEIGDCAACKKKNQTELDALTDQAKKLLAQHPDSPAAQKTKSLLDSLKIKAE